jgi:hypothetical protein
MSAPLQTYDIHALSKDIDSYHNALVSGVNDHVKARTTALSICINGIRQSHFSVVIQRDSGELKDLVRGLNEE